MLNHDEPRDALTVRLGRDAADRLRAAARANRRSMTAEVAMAVDEHLARERADVFDRTADPGGEVRG